MSKSKPTSLLAKLTIKKKKGTIKKAEEKKLKQLLMIAAANNIRPIYQTYDSHNPFDPDSPHIRKRLHLHPNERFRRFGTWDKLT